MTMMSDIPVFYDCEASCIGGLPIEIGWAFIDTSTGEIQSESHLIKPPLYWDMQPVWDPDAEKLHGIPMARPMMRPPISTIWASSKPSRIFPLQNHTSRESVSS